MNWLVPAWEYIHTGGVIMLPLVLVSVLLWGCIIYRLLLLKQLYSNNISIEQACACVSKGEFSPECGGVAELLVRNFAAMRSGDPELDRRFLDEAALRVRTELHSGLSLISILAAVAPLLGLLGTVLGMISTFDTIALFGNSNPRAMAGGISEALITTQTGLIVAIPGLFMRNFIQRRADALDLRLNALTQALKRSLEPQDTCALTATGGEI
jgi:biopolymer transport protein ExbB